MNCATCGKPLTDGVLHFHEQPEPITLPFLVEPSPDCSCAGAWASVLPPPPCPVHGFAEAYRWRTSFLTRIISKDVQP